MVAIQMPSVLYSLIKLQGGMDQVTPTLSIPPGFVRRGSNFECSITGGYSRIVGYERFDGHAKPNEAAYWLLTADIISLSVGSTITDAIEPEMPALVDKALQRAR